MDKRLGFTLIELLIVVAIIAILAAIAVPNFLEAQTRSKVSRARTDLRSIATALESYAVDHNTYPLMRGAVIGTRGTVDQFPGDLTGWGDPRGNAWRVIPIPLTTPQAYITSTNMPDPFKKGATDDRSPYKPYDSPNPSDLGYVYHNIFEYVQWGATGFGPADLEDYGLWRMFSLGPDKKYDPLGTADPTLGWIYDSTNGTMSSGNILRTQKDTMGQHFSRF